MMKLSYIPLICLTMLATQTSSSAASHFVLAGTDKELVKSVPVVYTANAFGCTGGNTSPELHWSGSPADVFFSADREWMDYLQSRKLIRIPTRHDVLGNRLVLVAPSDSKIDLKIARDFPLAAGLGKGRLATGDPDSVPVGRYARESLTKLGVWNAVEDRLVRAENVRSALAFVDRGEAPLGIVYETDALIDKQVRVVDVFPDDTHSPITYPIALTVVAKADATKFVDYVRGPTGEVTFKKYGFIPLH